MKTSVELCAEIELRLVDGQRAADDPALAAHVRSCLRCFRTATELREVPQIAALLREIDQPDPGDLFWARFPTSVADAWERRQVVAAPAAKRWWSDAMTAMLRWLQLASIGRWVQRPLPAALSGAAVAAVLVLAVVHRSPPTARPAIAAAPVAAVVPAAEAHDDDDESGGMLGDEDPLDSLELADVNAVVARMNLEPGGHADDGAEAGPSPVEEVELLETDDLRAVAQALRVRSQI